MKINRMDSSSWTFLPTIGDSNLEINESQFELKQEENEDIIEQAYNEFYTSSIELVKKNKRLKE